MTVTDAPLIASPPVDPTRSTESAPAPPEGPLGAVVVAAFETVWAAIQARHPEVPDVVMIMGSGLKTARSAMKYGHFHGDVWHGRDPETADANALPTLPEVFVGGEGMARPPWEVVGTLIHEAAHGLAHVREIKDTSRQGRWHNAKFKALAEELGIEVAKDSKIGWSVTTIPERTIRIYEDEIDALGLVLVRYRDARGPDRTARKKVPPLVCACERKIRAAKKTLELGPIQCGVCGQPFQFAETDDEDED